MLYQTIYPQSFNQYILIRTKISSRETICEYRTNGNRKRSRPIKRWSNQFILETEQAGFLNSKVNDDDDDDDDE